MKNRHGACGCILVAHAREKIALYWCLGSRRRGRDVNEGGLFSRMWNVRTLSNGRARCHFFGGEGVHLVQIVCLVGWFLKGDG